MIIVSSLNLSFLIVHILGISDLKDVIYAMNQSNFPDHRWSPLGLQLGLLQPTLSHIRAKYKDDPENCLQKCLALWLNKADEVTESGGSTWESLADALHKIGEDSAAETIRAFSKKINDEDVRTSHLLFPKPQLDKKLISAINFCKVHSLVVIMDNL